MAPRRRIPGVALGLVALLLLGRAGRAPAQDRAPDPCDIRTTERVVAVGDVHGAYERFVAILRAAGLIDGRQRWTGGRAILVQTGDVLDRGADSRRVLDLLRRLEDEADRAGGQVHALLGNHEVMRMVGDLRYVSSGEYGAFRSPDAELLRDRLYALARDDAAAAARRDKRRFDETAFRRAFMKQTPLGLVEMQLAFGAQGEYGRWLVDRQTMLRINDIVFVHGGISPEVAPLGCAQINATVRAEVRSLPERDAGKLAAFLSTKEEGPLWYRGLALNDEAAFAPEVQQILRVLDARAIVIGHTAVGGGRVTPRFDGRVLPIDGGMLGGAFFPSGRAVALEILGERVTAIYEDRREVLLPAPPPSRDAGR